MYSRGRGETLQILMNELLMEVNDSSDMSHKTPASSCRCFLSLLLAAVTSNQLNGLETPRGLVKPTFNIKLICKTLL